MAASQSASKNIPILNHVVQNMLDTQDLREFFRPLR
jgi:hypothetical protein